jgi:hypothetical protein
MADTSPAPARPAASFLLIESRRPGPDAGAGFLQDALSQARQGHGVILLLIQEAVELALPGRSAELDRLLAADGRLWVDRFSLLQRGLPEDGLRPGAQCVEMDEVARAALERATKVVWH